MNYLFIIDPSNYKGNPLNTMAFVTPEKLNDSPVHYTGETFSEYNEGHGGGLLALDWETYQAKYLQPFNDGLCEPFTETSEEQFNDMLNCLPPARWERGNTMEFFFVGECYTANLYDCYVRKGDKYYNALRPINASAQDIFDLK